MYPNYTNIALSPVFRQLHFSHSLQQWPWQRQRLLMPVQQQTDDVYFGIKREKPRNRESMWRNKKTLSPEESMALRLRNTPINGSFTIGGEGSDFVVDGLPADFLKLERMSKNRFGISQLINNPSDLEIRIRDSLGRPQEQVRTRSDYFHEIPKDAIVTIEKIIVEGFKNKQPISKPKILFTIDFSALDSDL